MSQEAGSQPGATQGASLPRYLVVHGRDGLALYPDWPQTALRVQGFPNAIFKKYRTGEDARNAYDRVTEIIAAHSGTVNVTPAIMASLHAPPAYQPFATAPPAAVTPAVPSTDPVAPPIPSPDPVAPPIPPSALDVASAPADINAASDAPAGVHDDLIAALEPYDTLSEVGVGDEDDTQSLLSVPEMDIDEDNAQEVTHADPDLAAQVSGIALTSNLASSAEADPEAAASRIITAVRYEAVHASRRPFPTVLPLLNAAVEVSLLSDSVRDRDIRATYIEDTAKMLEDVPFTGAVYYVIVCGRRPGVTRTNWSTARRHVDGIADAYYQVFLDGATAHRWWKQHRGEAVDHGPTGVASPVDNHNPDGPVPTANH